MHSKVQLLWERSHTPTEHTQASSEQGHFIHSPVHIAQPVSWVAGCNLIQISVHLLNQRTPFWSLPRGQHHQGTKHHQAQFFLHLLQAFFSVSVREKDWNIPLSQNFQVLELSSASGPQGTALSLLSFAEEYTKKQMKKMELKDKFNWNLKFLKPI